MSGDQKRYEGLVNRAVDGLLTPDEKAELDDLLARDRRHVAARGAEGVAHDLDVMIVGRAHDDGVHIRVGEQLLVLGHFLPQPLVHAAAVELLPNRIYRKVSSEYEQP